MKNIDWDSLIGAAIVLTVTGVSWYVVIKFILWIIN